MSIILDACGEIPVRTFEPATVLLEEGRKSGRLYVLADGQVEVLKGGFQVGVVSDPGALFGEMAVLLDTPHTATVRCVTACRLHAIEDADAFLRSNKEFAYDIARLLAQRLQGVTTQVGDLGRYIHSM